MKTSPKPHASRSAVCQRYADRLGAEWRRLTTDPVALREARSWAITEHRLADLDELLAAAGYMSDDATATATATVGELGNTVLGRLVTLADGSQLAGRIVLQRILPGLRAVARRWSGGCRAAGVAPDDVLGELVAVAWGVIRAYDVNRRPHHIAANLVHDAVGRAFVGPSRRKLATEEATDPDQFATWCHQHERSPDDELASALVDARRAGVAGRHLVLLGDLAQADCSTERVAIARGVSGRTIRSQRAAAVTQVRRALAA